MTFAKRQPRQAPTHPAAITVNMPAKSFQLTAYKNPGCAEKSETFFGNSNKFRRLQVRIQAHRDLFLLIDVNEPPRVPLVRIFTPHLGKPDFRYIAKLLSAYYMTTDRLYERYDMSTCVPLRTGMAEICLSDLVVMGNANGVISSRAATLESSHTIASGNHPHASET